MRRPETSPSGRLATGSAADSIRRWCRPANRVRPRHCRRDCGAVIITISKSLEKTRAGLRVMTTKSGEPRNVAMDEFELGVLADHRADQDKDMANFGSTYRDHGLVFSQPNRPDDPPAAQGGVSGTGSLLQRRPGRRGAEGRKLAPIAAAFHQALGGSRSYCPI